MNYKRALNIMIFMFVISFLCIINVNAASFGNITGGKKYKESFKVPINDAKDRIFTYDLSALRCESANSSVYDKPAGRLIKTVKDELICTIESSESKTLTLSLFDLDQNNETISISYEINPTPTTSINKPDTTSSTTKKDDVITTKAPSKSNNANLKELSIKDNEGAIVNLSPSFSSSIKKYDLVVSATSKTVDITAITEDAGAKVIISDNAKKELVQGENNEIIITIIAEDNITKNEYKLNIKREVLSSDAKLSSLSIDEVPDFKFNSDIYKYNIKIDKDISMLTLEYDTDNENTLVSITGNENLENNSKIKILVTAEDGTKKEYILTINKEIVTTKNNTEIIDNTNDKNPLVIMALSMIAFGLIGYIVYIAKK